MSWSAWLTDDRGHAEGDWNFTHNCNGMVRAVLADAGVVLPDSTHACSRPIDGEWRHFPNGYGTISWWEHLDGMTGPKGAEFLHLIILRLEADPERFRAMNPPNNWGDYDSLVKVLTDMRDRVPEWPTTWSTHG